MKKRLLHNPRCSKSREAKALLEGEGVDFEVVEYLKNPLSLAELKDLQKCLGVPAADMVRKKEDAYKARGLDKPGVTEEQILKAMAEDPVLLERPVLISGKKAVIGRPTERLRELL
jgi:arsenate reductase (glutaredoxin)